MAVLTVGVALFFISGDQVQGKTVMDVPVYAISRKQSRSLSGFGPYAGNVDENRHFTGFSSAYSIDPFGDAVLRLELDIRPKYSSSGISEPIPSQRVDTVMWESSSQAEGFEQTFF